jgi:hypothetical protein
MKALAVVQIIGAPVACRARITDTWREAAQWVASQLTSCFGDCVRVEYYDLFDVACPVFPTGLELPVVMVNGEVLTSGGKISVPAIRRKLEALGLDADRFGTGHLDRASVSTLAGLVSGWLFG